MLILSARKRVKWWPRLTHDYKWEERHIPITDQFETGDVIIIKVFVDLALEENPVVIEYHKSQHAA